MVTDLYMFKTRKSLEALDAVCPGASARLCQQERFSFSLRAQDVGRLKPMMQFLHYERLVLFVPTDEEHPEELISMRAIPLLKLNRVLYS